MPNDSDCVFRQRTETDWLEYQNDNSLTTSYATLSSSNLLNNFQKFTRSNALEKSTKEQKT